MKLNKKLIKQLRNGKIAVENNGTVEQLREVLKAAFPIRSSIPTGSCQYYSRSEINKDGWTAYPSYYEGKPTFKISEFYQPHPLPKFPKGGLVSELDLKPEPAILKPKCPNGLSFDIPKPDFIAKAKEIHNAYSEYKQLLKEKESIREALRECNTRIQETKSKIDKIFNNS